MLEVVSFLLLCTFPSVRSQVPYRLLSGTVEDVDGKVLSGCLLLLMDTTSVNESQYLGMEETDSIGSFCVETSPMVNMIIVNRLGYNSLKVPLSQDEEHFHIVLQRDTNTILNEVNVVANKKVVRVKPGGIEYDMRYSPIQSGEMINALRFVPLLDVSSKGDVKMVGKQQIAYYVNGRKIRFSGSALDAYLRSLRAEDIKLVEVLTAPDGRFQESLECGVVNIVTKQGEREGLKGTVNARIWKTHYLKGSGDVMLTYDRDKLSAYAVASGFWGSTWQRHWLDYDYRQNGDRRSVHSTYDGKDRNMNVLALLAYELTDYSSLTGQIYATYRPNRQEQYGNDYYYLQDGVGLAANIRNRNETKQTENRSGVTAEYVNSFGRPNTQLKLVVDYYYGNIRQKQEARMDSVFGDGTTRQHEYFTDFAPQKSHVWSGQGRYTFPVGAKSVVTVNGAGYYSKIDNDDRHSVWQGEAEGYVEDEMLSHNLKVREWGVSADAELTGTWNSHLRTVLGYRQNYRNYRSHMVNADARYEHGYWQPEVYASMVYMVNNNHVLTYQGGYSETAPSFDAMNPFRWYSSSSSYYVGNPALSPSKNVYSNFYYQFLQKYMVGVSYGYTGDGIENYQYVAEDGMVVSSPANILTSHRIYAFLNGGGLGYANNRGNVGFTAGLYGNLLNMCYPDGVYEKKSFWQGILRINHFFNLWPEQQLQMVNNGSYYSKMRYGLWEEPQRLELYTEIQKQIGNWTIGLSGFVVAYVVDKKFSFEGHRRYRTPALYIDNAVRGESYGYTLKVSYTFGNQKVKNLQKTQSSNNLIKTRLK